MFIALFLFRIILKPKTFNSLLPIVVFSALLEIFSTPIISLGDYTTLFNDTNHDIFSSFSENKYLTIVSGHFLLSPFKIWVNMLVILFAYKIVSPLIYNKTDNGW